TSLPRLLDVTPKSSDGPLPLDPELQLTFNQPMDRASVESNFALNSPSGRVAGIFTWNDKFTLATFKPSALLERDTVYTLTLGGQSRSRGGATLGSDTSFSYQSVLPFGVASTAFPSGTTRPLDKYDVSMTFSAPLAAYKDNELDSLITVAPAAVSKSIYLDGQTVHVNNFYTPGQSYSITFSSKLKDRWGQALGKDYVFTFREPDARPSINLDSSYLFARAEAPLVDAQVVNVSQLHIVLGSFTLTDFFRYQSDYNYRNAYSPNELASWDAQTNLTPNQNAPYTIDLSRKGQPLATGLYYVDISSSEVKQQYPAAASLLVSNVNLTLKTNANQAFVWAVDLRTQTPVANAAVALYDEKGNLQASGATDANGIWQGSFSRESSYQFNNYYGDYAVLGQPGDDLFGMAAENWKTEISAGDFGLRSGGSAPQQTIYLYTERPVYRPGDTVHYRGILRSQFDGRYTAADISSLSVSLGGPSGATAQNVSLSTYGSFNGEFTLSANAIPGSYYLDVSDDKSNHIDGGNIDFQVADYRKPEINLSATLSPDPATNGQAITGNVDAAYFFGAPAGDLPFEWRLYKQRSYFDIPGYNTGLYTTGWYSNDAGNFGGNIAQGKARTGADGSFSIPVDAIHVDDTTQLTLEITASESGGFPVSARATLVVHPANFYAGIRPDAWFGRAGNAVGFSILTVGLDNKALPNKMLLATFERVTWERSDLPYGYSFTPNYTPVESQQITTDADGKAHVIFTPAQTGTYMLEVAGDGAKSQVMLWVGGAQNVLWPNLPFQRMELTANQATYKPGETASIYIPSSFGAPAPALVTTERSSVLTSQVISVPPEGYTFNLPIGDDQAPNTYVSVTMLGPDADFRQGYINLPVEPSAFKLNVALKATPEKANPGDKLTLDLTVTDSKGRPAQAEFSMAVVDLAALALADPNSVEIVPAYYDIQPLGVNTGLTDAIYARRALPAPIGGRGGG
ncbi:MAG: MG2 domain-containing protein, partial [Anaerolineales bacterium]